jgi:hypothetical protein
MFMFMSLKYYGILLEYGSVWLGCGSSLRTHSTPAINATAKYVLIFIIHILTRLSNNYCDQEFGNIIPISRQRHV